MKQYTANKQTAIKTDRIERAVELIESGAAFEHRQGVWRVLTDRFAGGYTVQDGTCDCYDFEITLQGQSPCKHIWATFAAAVAMMIHDLRQASNRAELDSVVATYKDGIKDAPAAYVRVARAEYARLRDLFKAADQKRRDDEANAVLIKPQPKSNGRYGSIEI